MPIEFRCEQCNKLLRTGDGSEGLEAKCPECGTVMAIPDPDREQASLGAPAEGTAATSDPSNEVPAQPSLDSAGSGESPTDSDSTPSPSLPDGIRPTRIEVGGILSRTWVVFTERGWTVFGGMLVAGIASSPIYAAYLTVQIGVVPSFASPALATTVYLVNLLALMVYMVWITAGLQLFTLRIVRGEPARFGAIFSGARYLLPLIRCGFAACFVMLASVVMLFIPFVIFMLTIFQAQLLIIDRNQGVIAAMLTSQKVMVGNKLTLLGLLFVTTLSAELFCLMTCGLGIFAVVPYAIILQAVIYLGVTGQSTMADRYMLPTVGQKGSPFPPSVPGVPCDDLPVT